MFTTQHSVVPRVVDGIPGGEILCQKLVIFRPPLKSGQPQGSFCLFSFFSSNIFTEKCRLRTRIDGVECDHTDH